MIDNNGASNQHIRMISEALQSQEYILNREQLFESVMITFHNIIFYCSQCFDQIGSKVQKQKI